jgi:Glycosyltransferase Family 4
VTARLRVALLDHAAEPGRGAAGELARALAAAGHEPTVVSPAARSTLLDAPLRLRKIGDRPARIPGTLVSLARGSYDLAHAFTAQDAVAAVAWARLTGRPAVFTVSETLHRGALADRRLRLAQLRLAVERSSAVLAPDQAVAESVGRWLALTPRLVAPGSADDHLALYAELGRR